MLVELRGWETLEIAKCYAHLAPEHLKALANQVHLGSAATVQICHSPESDEAVG